MTLPIMHFAESFSTKLSQLQDTTKEKISVSLTIVDGVAVITTLALGVLSLLSIISMPAALSYALVGVGGAFTALWIAMAIKTKGECFSWISVAFKKTFCSDNKAGQPLGN
jgi:hypothetical protein